MAMTFCEMSIAVNEIQSRVSVDNGRLNQARAMFATASSDLSSIGPAYPGFLTDVNAAIAANPGNVAYQNLKASFDATCADLQALYGKLQTIQNAIADALGE